MEIFHYRSRVDEGEIAGELETIRHRGDASAHRQSRPGISRLVPSMTLAAVISKDVNPPSLIVRAAPTFVVLRGFATFFVSLDVYVGKARPMMRSREHLGHIVETAVDLLCLASAATLADSFSSLQFGCFGALDSMLRFLGLGFDILMPGKLLGVAIISPRRL